ncbi:MAG TPA: hypothetical protein VF652_08310 [Allosphingosinicella sp.]|jgi:hypothetical protein
MRIHPAFVPAYAARPLVELSLQTRDGSPWRLTMSAGMERFIGYYPKVDGIDSGEPLLAFRAINPVG